MLDCGRVAVNATMLRRIIGGLLREQDRREDRHTEDVHILCIDVIIASDMLTSKLCIKAMPWLEREEEIRCSGYYLLSTHRPYLLPSLSVECVGELVWILDFGSLREREDTLSKSKWALLENKGHFL